MARARALFDGLSSSSSVQIFGEVMVTDDWMTVRDDHVDWRRFRCHEEAIRLPKRRRRNVVALRCRGSLANGVAINVETIFIPLNQDQFQFTQFNIIISGQTLPKHANRMDTVGTAFEATIIIILPLEIAASLDRQAYYIPRRRRRRRRLTAVDTKRHHFSTLANPTE